MIKLNVDISMRNCIHIPDKKRNAYSRFFHFSEPDPIFQLFQLYRSVDQSSPVYAQTSFDLSKSETVISPEIKEGLKSYVTNVSILSMATISMQTHPTKKKKHMQ